MGIRCRRGEPASRGLTVVIGEALRPFMEALRGHVGSVNMPALILAGGALSAATILAAQAVGRSVQPYAVTFGERPARAFQVAAAQLGRDLKLIELPKEGLAADFIHLAFHHKCMRVDEFGLGLVALHVCEAVPEMEIWLPVRASPSAWSIAARIGHLHRKSLVDPFANVPAALFGESSDLERLILELTEAQNVL
jgi:hypothetical protein